MLGLFALLLLGLSLLAILPLARNLQANRYKLHFRLMLEDDPDFCKNVPNTNTGELLWKEKEYVTNNWSMRILKTSLGNYCGPDSFSNALDCGDTCTLERQDVELLKKQWNGNFGDEASKKMICQKTYPCSTPCNTARPDDQKGGSPNDGDPNQLDTRNITPCCVFGSTKYYPVIPIDDDDDRKRVEEQCQPRFRQVDDDPVFHDIKKKVQATQFFQDKEAERIAINDQFAEYLLEDFKKKVRVHVWLWCVPGMLFFVVWISLLQYLQHALAEAGNRQNVNVSQYAVMLSNVGGVVVDDDRLKDFGRYYGDVVAAFHIRNYGRYLAKNLARQTGNGLLRELERVKQECEVPDNISCSITIQRRFVSFPGSWFFWLYKRWLCWHMSVDDTIRALEARDEELAKEIKALSSKPDESTGNAIIVFNWVHNAANMLYDHNSRNSLANLFVPPAAGQFFNIATGGVFARTPKIALTTEGAGSQRITTHRHVSVSRAPEPNDLWWESTWYGGWLIIRRRILAWVMYFALLLVAFAVQVYLARLSSSENWSILNENLRGLRVSSGRSDQEQGQKLPILNVQTLDSLKWTIVKTVATLVFSSLGIQLIYYISDFSLFVKHTRHNGSTITKIALFQLINSFLVPVVAFLASRRESFSLWYTTGGLAELAFLIQVANAFAGSIAFLYSVDDVFYLHFLSRMACSKLYADEYMHPPAFRMNLRLGQAITTVGLCILYAPILPISPMIGVLGTLFQYAVDQYVALRHSSKPRAIQVEALTGVNYILRLLPLAQVLLIWGLYFNVGEPLPEILGIVIWGAACITPLMNRTRHTEYKRWVEGGRPRLLDWAKPPGQKQATWTNHAQMTSALNILPDLPKGFRFNFDTYLPDVPSLDSEIFTSSIKPHFTYHKPPLPQTRFAKQPGQTGKIGNFEYEEVAPKEEFTQALARAEKVDVPYALAHTCTFRPTEIAESPEFLSSDKGSIRSKALEDRIKNNWKPKVFTPDSAPNGANRGAAPPPPSPQTFLPIDAVDEAPSAPDDPAPLNNAGVFVPDDDGQDSTSMPPPPTNFSAQQQLSRGNHEYEGGGMEQNPGYGHHLGSIGSQ